MSPNQYPPPPTHHFPHPYPISLSAGETSADHQYPEPPNSHDSHPQTHKTTTPRRNDEDSSAVSPGQDHKDHKGRLRKACDSCSTRKVKCDDEGPPCRPCVSLDIPCTFDKPSKRRGPPNRHAENMKKRRLDTPSTPGLSIPPSPTQFAHTLASFASHQVLSAEAICPLPVLLLLVDDYFTYIHPLIPVPHEPSFRESLQRREDVTNSRFLSLLAAMIGSLVASFPRKPRQHLKAQNKEHLFPNSLSLVDRCHNVAIEARGVGYLDKHLDVYDAITSYFLGLIAGYTFRWPRSKNYFGECITISKVIGLHRSHSYSDGYVNNVPSPVNVREDIQERNVDLIRQEMRKRTFWVLFVSIKSLQQLGLSFRELSIPPASKSEPFPPLPMEVDDPYIFSDIVQGQPPDLISQMTAFNLNVKIYRTYEELYTMEILYGPCEIYNWEEQKCILERCLRTAQRALDEVPPELLLQPNCSFERVSHPGVSPRPPEYFGAPGVDSYPYVKIGDDMAEKRRLQCEIQKANIYGSALSTRSFIVERFWNMYDLQRQPRSGLNSNPASNPNSPGFDNYLSSAPTSSCDPVERQMATERESIIRDLLNVLGSIDQINMEPNGGSFINKIRQIASTLLDVPRTRKGQLAQRAESILAAFVDILMKLERVYPREGREGSLEGDDNEEAELRAWADLRAEQIRFAQAGGFTTELRS